MRREPDEAIYEALANQSLRRPLDGAERALADALDVIFGRGEHDFAAVAGSLQSAGIRRPSGGREPWTAQVLDDELKRINASLDEAYTQRA
jgi:recombinase-like protein